MVPEGAFERFDSVLRRKIRDHAKENPQRAARRAP
jgi:hypothetical protein